MNRTKKFQKEIHKKTASVDRTRKEETEWDKEVPERNRLNMTTVFQKESRWCE